MKENPWVKVGRLAVGATVVAAGARMLAKPEVVHAQGVTGCNGLVVSPDGKYVQDYGEYGGCIRWLEEKLGCISSDTKALAIGMPNVALDRIGANNLGEAVEKIKVGDPTLSCDGGKELIIEQVQATSAPMSLGFVEAVVNPPETVNEAPAPVATEISGDTVGAQIARQDAKVAANSEMGWQGAAEALPYVAIPVTLFAVGSIALAIHNNSKNAQESKESEREFYKGIRRSREQNNSVPVKSPKLANEVEKESAQEDLEVDDASTVVRRRRRVSLDKVEKPEYWSKAGMDNVKRNIKLPSNQRVGITQAFRNGIYEKIEEETLKRNGLSKEELKRMAAEQNRRDGIMFNNLYGKKR